MAARGTASSRRASSRSTTSRSGVLLPKALGPNILDRGIMKQETFAEALRNLGNAYLEVIDAVLDSWVGRAAKHAASFLDRSIRRLATNGNGNDEG